MKQNEPIAANRRVMLRLTRDTGDGNGPQGVAGAVAGAVVLIALPGGNLAALAGTALVEIIGGNSHGQYALDLPISAASLVGRGRIEVTNAGVIDPVDAAFDVDALDSLYYGAVANVADATHIDLDATNPGGTASAVDGFYASAGLGRSCTVTVVAGAGAHQTRSGIDYIAANHRLQIDEAFAANLNNTSIVRIDPIASVGGASVIAQQILDAVFEGPDQYDGLGEALPQGGALADYNVTIAQGLREILAYCSGNATQLNGLNPIVKSRVGLRNRIVAQMNNGNRTVTSRNNT